VAGHDPERGGRLVYRGRVGAGVGLAAARAALRLATANALVSAREAVGHLSRVQRCAVFAAFVDARPSHLVPRLIEPSLRLLRTVLGTRRPPAVWLRPAQGLAGGMPVEVELLLVLRPPPGRQRAPARARTPPGRRAR
jgi:hypothetical protein